MKNEVANADYLRKSVEPLDDAYRPALHMVCGKIAAGKSTLTAQLALAPKTLLISEDKWLAALYPGELVSLADYVRCTSRLRNVMQSHIESMLLAGVSVVLDFPANTSATRDWMKAIFMNANAAHVLHYLDVSDAECKARLRRRNEDGVHQFNTSDAEFDQFTKYFVPPSEDEGFNIVRE
ncbi:AAA family ATPase [Undibacterium sp.]|uniref:AAA family ATPase n=1 Tax=Undibacterium sp. TaxID=1914977 RepID=UPI00374DEAA6